MAVTVARRTRRRPGRRLLAHDRDLGARLVAGADEAGRGALAGPLVAAAVCLDVDRLRGARCAPLGMLDDSKRHTEARREELFEAVIACASQVAVCVIPASDIDRRGLHRSNLYALGRALCALDPEPDVCLTDGFPVPRMPRRQHRAVVGGDGRSAAIAAASIVAKVTRDRFMRRIAPRYPGFGRPTPTTRGACRPRWPPSDATRSTPPGPRTRASASSAIRRGGRSTSRTSA